MKMTQISQGHYDDAKYGNLSLSDALKKLEDTSFKRSTKRTIIKFSELSEQDDASLAKFLKEKLIETNPNENPENIRKNVSNWLNGKTAVSKQNAIQISFALNLDIDKADSFLKEICSEGLHWRDPSEIVYIYALMHSLKYSEATKLLEELTSKGIISKKFNGNSNVYTYHITSMVKTLTSISELEEFLIENRESFGTFHNTAYSIFLRFMKRLGMPNLDYYSTLCPDDIDKVVSDEKILLDIKKYASTKIIETYLHRKFVPFKNNNKKAIKDEVKLSALQEEIRSNWPEDAAFSKMLTKKTDVTRKALILLFLATNGEGSDYVDDSIEDFTAEEMFDDISTRLNYMLSDCGFSDIDPRAPFDWMILYCICTNEAFHIDEKLQSFLATVFDSSNQ